MLLKYLIILFVGVPLLELMLLLKIGEICGLGFTISLVLITGFAGAILAKSQGITAWNRIQTELSEGRMPGDQLIDGLMVLAGGITLLTPGLLTDTIGLCLLVPVTRTVIKKWVHQLILKKLEQGDTSYY